jgi:hypothetical protein
MPLIGVSYQCEEKDEEYISRFSNKTEIKRIIQTALRLGIIKFAASSAKMSRLAPLHLKVLREIIEEGLDIDIIPCISIPLTIGGRSVDAFRRWATYLEIEKRNDPNILKRVMEDPILNFREGWRDRLPQAEPYGKKDFEKIQADWNKVHEALENFVDLPVSIVEPGSETDFLAMTERFDLLGGLIDRIKDSGYDKIVFGVHHSGETIPRLEKSLRNFDGYVTPLNSMGIMMLPTQESAEKAIQQTRNKIFAIKPLAGGRIKPGEAYRYIFNFDIEACMFGAATKKEVEENYEEALKAMRSKS